MQKQEFEAEVLFLNPADVPHAITTLAAAELEFEIDPTAVDPCGPTLFGTVTGMTELNEGELGLWLSEILGRHGGDVVEWGLCAEIARRLREAGAS